MDKYRNYEVNFSGLKNGKHKFQFEIDKAFFKLFETEQEFTNPRVVAEVLLEKHSTFLEFWITTKGVVTLLCDISNEEFDHEIESDFKILVKFGETYDDSNEEVITISHTDHSFNVSQLIYENVMLSIPMKKVSPNLKDEDLEIIEKYSSKEVLQQSIEEQIDPRWKVLEKLKNKN